MITSVINWRLLCRLGFGRFKPGAISWMFRHSKTDRELLFQMSKSLIQSYGIKEAVLTTDDSDKKRSKSSKKIYGLHKFKDKVSGGYSNGQELVMLQLVTHEISITVGFDFYAPDSVRTEWNRNN